MRLIRTAQKPAEHAAVLRLDAQDSLARATQARLLIQLDRFAEVAGVVQDDEGMLLQRAYALYKLGKEREALALIEGKTEDDRGLRALEGQIVRLQLLCCIQLSRCGLHRDTSWKSINSVEISMKSCSIQPISYVPPLSLDSC